MLPPVALSELPSGLDVAATCPGHLAWPVKEWVWVDADGNELPHEDDEAWTEGDADADADGDDPRTGARNVQRWHAEYGCESPSTRPWFTPSGVPVAELVVLVNNPTQGRGRVEGRRTHPLPDHRLVTARRGPRRIRRRRGSPHHPGRLSTESYLDRDTDEKRTAQRVTAEAIGYSLALTHP